MIKIQFLGLFLSSVVVEGIVSYIIILISAFGEKKIPWKNILAIILGVFVSFSYQIDIFNSFGFKSIFPQVGVILTGILISRGSNYIYDTLKLIMNLTAKIALNNEIKNK